MSPPTVAQRKRLATKGQAQPDGSYPTDTRGRAIAAKGRAKTAEERGRISKSTEAAIDTRANRKLGKSAKKRS